MSRDGKCYDRAEWHSFTMTSQHGTVLLVLMTFCLSGAVCYMPPGQACTGLFAYGVNATVTNAITGAPINNATLTLVEGSYQEVMQSFPTGDYVGAGERAGTYDLTASAQGFQTQTIDNIVVTADPCHVQGVHLDVKLQPAIVNP